jgi:hypothetical protein
MPIIYFFVLLEIAAVVGVSEPTIKLAFKPLYENRFKYIIIVVVIIVVI